MGKELDTRKPPRRKQPATAEPVRLTTVKPGTRKRKGTRSTHGPATDDVRSSRGKPKA